MGMRMRVALVLALALALPAAAHAQTRPSAKHKAPARAPAAPAEEAIDFSADPSVKLLLENDRTAVYRLELSPQGSSALHRHSYDYLLIALSRLDARAVWGKNESRSQNMEPGQMDIVTTPVEHQIVNQAAAPYRALIVELKAGFHPNYIVCGLGRRSCPTDTGDLQDPAGRYDVSELFETDTVAVLKVAIGPGATLARRTEKYPALRVALSPLSLSDVVGDKTVAIHQDPGDAQWVPAEGTHTLSNPTSDDARFYWIEFK